MKPPFMLAAIFVSSSLFLIAATPSNGTGATAKVPRGTIIPVLITREVRVGGMGVADEQKKVEFEVAQDVIVNGMLFAQKGDLVEGHFTTERNVTQRYFSTDVSQEVSLDVDDLVNFCGDTVHLKFERTFVGGARAGILSFGAHAHDTVFAKGTVLKAKTDRVERGICAQSAHRATPPLPQDMVIPDEEVTPTPHP